MIAEMVCQVKRHHVIQQERKRLWDFTDLALKDSVVHFLQAMAQAGDQQLWRQLVDVGVPEHAIQKHIAAGGTPESAKQWQLWRQKHCCARPVDDVAEVKSGIKAVGCRYPTAVAPVDRRRVDGQSSDRIGEANRTAVSIDALLDWVGEDVAHLRAVFESYLTEGESVCESGCLMKLLIDCGVELDPADLRRELALLGLATGRS